MFEILTNRFFVGYLRLIAKSSCLTFVTFFSLIYLTVNAQDDRSQPLNFYLPISSQNQQTLLEKLHISLNENALTNIEIKFSDHWHDYQQGLKNGRVGIYLSPPHFAAWAINKHSFTPIVRIAEPLSFVVAAKRIQPEIFALDDLINKNVCTQRPLNLDYLVRISAFKTLFGSAKNKFVSDVSLEMLAQESECDGFAVSNHVLQNLQAKGNNDYIRLYQGPTYNNYALIADPSINTDTLEKLNHYFLQAETLSLFKPIFSLYANEVTLIRSAKEDYPLSYIDTLKSHWK